MARRMFGFVTDTWNPETGCNHKCSYCWARDLASGKLSKELSVEHYKKHGFRPAVNENQFRRSFKPNNIVFVCDMGELFGEWVPREWIERVIGYTHKFHETRFLYLTKNPRYEEFLDLFTERSILGATIETNREDLCSSVSQAPSPLERYKMMKNLDWPHKFVSVEPILDFDMDIFLEWMREMGPEMCALGYDNYENRLPEPSLDKTRRFSKEKEKLGIKVEHKTLRPAWWEGR